MGENEDEQKEINSASDELSNIGNTTANIAKGTAKAAKKTAKTVKNITKLVKLLAKSKFVLMALPIIIKVVAVVLIVIAIIALFALIWMFLSVNLSKNVSDVIRNDNINSIVTIDNDKLEYSIDPKFKEQIEDILSIIQTSVAVTPEYIEKLYKAEIMASYPDLRPRDKIGTQYATNEKDDYFQGTIKIKRKYYDGKEELLEYMNYDDFREEVAKFGNYELLDKDGNISTQEKIYTSKKEVESGYDKLKKYFTLDSEYNLVVATISSTEVTNKYNDFAKKERRKIVDGKTVEGRKDNDKYKYEYNINIKKQNYQKSIERYVLPVEFNLIMLAVSQNQGFSEKLLELIEDTRITIEVQDNYTKNTVTEKYGYTAQFEYEKKVKYKEKIIVDDLNDSLQVNQIVDEDLQNPEDSITITQNNKEKWEDKEYKSEGKYTEQKNMDKPFSEITTNTQEILTNILVTDAKSWIGDFSVVYSYEKEEPEPTVSSVPLENDANFTTIVDYYVLHDEFIESLDDLPENVGETKNVEITSKKVKEKQKDKENITITKYESNRYIKSTVNIEEKEERFLSLLAVDPSSKPKQFNKVEINKNTEKLIYKDYSGKEFPPVENIFIFKNMMFEMLRNFENTQYLEEIMKYMLYMYSGKNYGVTTLDFSIYEPGNFISVGASTALWNNSISKEEFIKQVENYSPNITSSEKRQGYDKFFLKNAQSFFDIATSYNIDPRFIFCIGIHESDYGTSDIALDKGNFFGWGAYDGSPYDSALTFYDMSDGIETVCKGLANNYISSTGDWYQWIIDRGYDPTTIEGIGARYATDTEWASKVKEHMQNIFKIEFSDNFGSLGEDLVIPPNSTFLEVAKKCHDFVKNNNYYYSSAQNISAGKYVKDGKSIGSKVPKPAKGEGTYIDCSAYVSWVLFEYGYAEFAGWQKSSSWFANVNVNQYGWVRIKATEAKPGDILVKKGHVEIYVGDGKSYSCGSTNSIRKDTISCNLNEFNSAIRIKSK